MAGLACYCLVFFCLSFLHCCLGACCTNAGIGVGSYSINSNLTLPAYFGSIAFWIWNSYWHPILALKHMQTYPLTGYSTVASELINLHPIFIFCTVIFSFLAAFIIPFIISLYDTPSKFLQSNDWQATLSID